jgi:hypothetical protein
MQFPFDGESGISNWRGGPDLDSIETESQFQVLLLCECEKASRGLAAGWPAAADVLKRDNAEMRRKAAREVGPLILER